MAPIASANRRTNRVFPVQEVPARMTKGFDLRETAHQSSGLEVLLETYPDFASGFLRGGLQKGVGKLLPDVFSEVPVIKCCNYRLTGTSMSQVVGRFAFDKIQSQLFSFQSFQYLIHNRANCG